jgi:hypothetical protein
MAPGFFQTLQNTGDSGSVNKIYLIIYIGRYNITTFVRFRRTLLLHHRSPTFLWQLLLYDDLQPARGQTAVNGILKLVCNFYSTQ